MEVVASLKVNASFLNTCMLVVLKTIIISSISNLNNCHVRKRKNKLKNSFFYSWNT